MARLRRLVETFFTLDLYNNDDIHPSRGRRVPLAGWTNLVVTPPKGPYRLAVKGVLSQNTDPLRLFKRTSKRQATFDTWCTPKAWKFALRNIQALKCYAINHTL